MNDKAPCQYCGTLDAVDVPDGWTKRLDDLYTEWCKGHASGVRDVLEYVKRLPDNGDHTAALCLIEIAARIQEEFDESLSL